MTIVRLPVRGELTQGAIFSAALAEDYDQCAVWGLVITARCDIANDKAPVWNYLPVVRLEDWLHRDGRSLLVERVHSDQRSKLKSLLRESGFSPSILDTEAPEHIVQRLFPSGDA